MSAASRTVWAVCVAFSLVACGGSDDQGSFSDCGLGELTGTWRMHYEETDGNCGAVADETAVFDPGAPLAPGCVNHSQSVSDDRCRMDMSFECPTTDEQGSQAWVMVMRQIARDRLEGTGTLQLDHPDVLCRSTYDLTVAKL